MCVVCLQWWFSSCFTFPKQHSGTAAAVAICVLTEGIWSELMTALKGALMSFHLLQPNSTCVSCMPCFLSFLKREKIDGTSEKFNIFFPPPQSQYILSCASPSLPSRLSLLIIVTSNDAERKVGMTIKWDQRSKDILCCMLNACVCLEGMQKRSWIFSHSFLRSLSLLSSRCRSFHSYVDVLTSARTSIRNQFCFIPRTQNSSPTTLVCFPSLDDLCVHGLRLWAASVKLWMIGLDIGDYAENFHSLSVFFCVLSIVIIFHVVRTRARLSQTLTPDSYLGWEIILFYEF